MDYGGIWLVAAAAGGWLLKSVADILLRDWLTTHKETVKRAMNFRLLMMLLGMVLIALLVRFAYAYFNKPVPATRQDVLIGMGFLAFAILLFVNTLDDLVGWARRTWRPEKAAPPVGDVSQGRGAARKPRR